MNQTQEHKSAQSVAMKAKWADPEYRKKRKQIVRKTKPFNEIVKDNGDWLLINIATPSYPDATIKIDRADYFHLKNSPDHRRILWNDVTSGRSKNGGYALLHVRIEGKWTPLFLHRVINNTPKGLQTDHINRCRDDNRRFNLRTVTAKENQQNKTPKVKFPCKFCGSLLTNEGMPNHEANCKKNKNRIIVEAICPITNKNFSTILDFENHLKTLNLTSEGRAINPYLILKNNKLYMRLEKFAFCELKYEFTDEGIVVNEQILFSNSALKFKVVQTGYESDWVKVGSFKNFLRKYCIKTDYDASKETILGLSKMTQYNYLGNSK